MTEQLTFDQIDLRDDPPAALPPPPPPPPPAPPEIRPFVVDVIRSAKRRKTSQARLRGSVLEVRIPSWVSVEQEHEIVAGFVDRFERTQRRELIDLDERAAVLSERHDLPRPDSIRWVSNQNDRWGSCTPARGTIRVSDRMAGFPQWVIDYVVVHELAHLVHLDHSPAFWGLVARYPLSERARGYLMAKASDTDC